MKNCYWMVKKESFLIFSVQVLVIMSQYQQLLKLLQKSENVIKRSNGQAESHFSRISTFRSISYRLLLLCIGLSTLKDLFSRYSRDDQSSGFCFCVNSSTPLLSIKGTQASRKYRSLTDQNQSGDPTIRWAVYQIPRFLQKMQSMIESIKPFGFM